MKTNFLILLLSLTLYASAQDFEVSPMALYYNSEPGESQTRFIKVKNHNSRSETFIISLSDYAVNSNGIGEYVDAGSMKYSIADWVSITPLFFEIQPNEEKEISITVQQPADDFSSKWGCLFIRTAQEQNAFSSDKSLSAGINISARIVVNIYQTPNANSSFKATISNLMEISNDEDSIRTFSSIINNLSDIITQCSVYVIATNVETAEETIFPDQKFTMYPKSSRKLELYMPNTLPKGTYSLAAILDYGSKTNLEGTQIMIKVE